MTDDQSHRPGRPRGRFAGLAPVGWRIRPETLEAFDAMARVVDGKRETRAELFERLVIFVVDNSARA